MSTRGEQTKKQETRLQQLCTRTSKPQWHLRLTSTDRFTGPDKFIDKIQVYIVDSALLILTFQYEKSNKFAGPLRRNSLRWSARRDKPVTWTHVDLDASSVTETLYKICLWRLNSRIWITGQLRLRLSASDSLEIHSPFDEIENNPTLHAYPSLKRIFFISV